MIPYHAAVVFAMAMSMTQAHTNQEIINNLYWIVPINLFLASIPNIIIVLFYKFFTKESQLFFTFIKAELYIVALQLILHGALIVLSIYGQNI